MKSIPPRFDRGSFRDRSSRVFYQDGRVCRYLDAGALKEWDSLSTSPLYPRLLAMKRIGSTHRVEVNPETLKPPWVAVLEHDRIPFISYPYEWSFGMLQDAAAAHLDLISAALEEDFILRDCSPFNIQWTGARPLFIDIPSFALHQSGEVWAGYQQFCRTFLYPLLFQAYKGIAFQRWLRSLLEGIPAEEMTRLFSWWEFFRPGLLADVFLEARLERSWAKTERTIRTEMRDAGFPKEFILKNVRRLLGIVRGLRVKRHESEWSDYANERNYSPEDYAAKKEFVKSVCARRSWDLAWDLGCNTGDFSLIAADHASCVVAMDADDGVVENLYRRLKTAQDTRVLPLVMNLADPSPAQGWAGRERKSLTSRGKPDLVMALALLHHLVIGANVPLADAVAWLASLGAELVVEFVGKEDSMVQRLLLNREDIFTDYDRPHFEALLETHYRVEKKIPLVQGGRWLYHAVPKSTA
ncbi:MAG: class I SAM-dependent methyltransferase [Elusimicrobia bacterium]|nr:class I SAM-dependent methyltransferase [Elusimicrobiota bacterium]